VGVELRGKLDVKFRGKLGDLSWDERFFEFMGEFGIELR
jgi:hypothetical protein